LVIKERLLAEESIVNRNTPISSGRDGLDVVRILETAQYSMINGQAQEVLKW